MLKKMSLVVGLLMAVTANAKDTTAVTVIPVTTERTLFDLVRSRIAQEEQKISIQSNDSSVQGNDSPPLRPVPPMKTSPLNTQPLDKLKTDGVSAKLKLLNVGGVGRMLKADLSFDGQIVYGAVEGGIYFGWNLITLLPHKAVLEQSGVKKSQRQKVELFLTTGSTLEAQ